MKNYNEYKIQEYSNIIRIYYSKFELQNTSKEDLINLLYDYSKAYSYFNNDSRYHYSEINKMKRNEIINILYNEYLCFKERSRILESFIEIIRYFRNKYSYINDENDNTGNNTVNSVNSIFIAFKYCGKKIRKEKIDKMDKITLINKILKISWAMAFLTEGAIYELNDDYLNSLSRKELIRYLKHYNSNKMRSKVLNDIDLIIDFLYDNSL